MSKLREKIRAITVENGHNGHYHFLGCNLAKTKVLSLIDTHEAEMEGRVEEAMDGMQELVRFYTKWSQSIREVGGEYVSAEEKARAILNKLIGKEQP